MIDYAAYFDRLVARAITESLVSPYAPAPRVLVPPPRLNRAQRRSASARGSRP